MRATGVSSTGHRSPAGESFWRWAGWVGLLLYVPLLAWATLGPGVPMPGVSFARLRSVSDVLGLAARLFLAVAFQAALLAPFGFCAALAAGRRDRFVDRLLRVWLPATTLTLVLTLVVGILQSGPPWAVPSPSGLLVPALFGLLGVALGVTWGEGRRARSRLVAVATLLLVVLAGGVAYAASLVLESEPFDFAPTAVTSAEKRRVYRKLDGKDPRRIPEGRTERLDLTAQDLNLLVAWGLSLTEPSRKARVELDRDYASLALSARLPGGLRYLNVFGSAEAAVQDGRLWMSADHLSVGRLDVPSWVLHALSPSLARIVATDKRVRSVLLPIRSVAFTKESVQIAYGRSDIPTGFVADLFHGEGTGGEDLPVARAHALHLIEVARSLPGGDERFPAALRAAFAHARDRARDGKAVQENRGALLALGILLGHWRVQGLVGPVLEEKELRDGRSAYRGSTLRGRQDWVKHFSVSGALTVLAHGAVSDATGVFKEELDADGGSGFSFADLLADRAGTTLATLATRDEASARRMQARLSGGFRVDDVFPPAADLPEGIPDAELQARYGGVGGTAYRRWAEEVEKRLRTCAAYR